AVRRRGWCGRRRAGCGEPLIRRSAAPSPRTRGEGSREPSPACGRGWREAPGEGRLAVRDFRSTTLALVKLSPRVRDLLEVALLLGVWAMTIAIIRPVGDFPLHDDWDFAIATWRFARTGQFHFTQFTAVSLRAQVLWGALWTHFFGESFEVLRASTLTLSAAT